MKNIAKSFGIPNTMAIQAMEKIARKFSRIRKLEGMPEFSTLMHEFSDMHKGKTTEDSYGKLSGGGRGNYGVISYRDNSEIEISFNHSYDDFTIEVFNNENINDPMRESIHLSLQGPLKSHHDRMGYAGWVADFSQSTIEDFS